MAPHDGDRPSERSPLLSQSTKDVSAARDYKSAQQDSVLGQENVAADAPPDVARDAGEVERQASNEDREELYRGMPEALKRMKYTFPALAIGVFLSACDQTLIVSSAPKIGTELDALNQVSWVATAYFLTLTSFQPLFGKLSDIFGRKPCLLIGYFIFGVGTLYCGLSRTMTELIFARALAGLGAAGMNTIVSIVLSDVIPLRERGTWQGYINIVFAAGSSSGAPLGGVFADKVSWRWSFLFQVPLCAIAFVAVAIALKLPSRDEGNWRQKLRRIDFLGSAVLIVAIFAFLVGVDRGSNISWTATATLVPLCLSLPFLALFVLVELKYASEPIAPREIIFQSSHLACYLTYFFSMAGFMGIVFYLPEYWQAVDGYTATGAGLLMIPGIVATVVGSLFGGIYMRKTGKYFWISVWCYFLAIVGAALILLFAGLIMSLTPMMIVGHVLAGFGAGSGTTTTLIALISNAKREEQAVATAVSYLFRSLGSTVGIAMSSTVANQVLRSSLHKQLGSGKDAEKIIQRARRSLEYIKTLEPSIRDTVRQCFAFAVRSAFALQVVLVVAAFCATWVIKERPLSK